MLTLFTAFRAPRVSYVDIFRDHADPQQFYLLPDRPRIAVDAQSGLPLFNFTLFSRNIEIAYASATAGQPVESQLGAMNLTVDLSVPEPDLALIRQHLATVLQAEIARPSAYNKLFKVATTAAAPKVGYVDTWLNGTVRLAMLEDLGTTFKRNSSKETHPTLRGTNAAALWATFGTEGAQLLWRTLRPERGEPGGQANASGASVLQANIVYELEGFGRVPALRVTVHADGSTVYRELRTRMQVTERVNGSTWSYPQLSNLTKSLVDSRVIDVKWDDWGIPSSDPEVNEIKDQLQQTVMGIITNQIMSLFFKQYELKGLRDEDLGTTFTHSLGGKPGSRLWLNEFKEEMVSNIDFTLEMAQNAKFKVNPQVSLLTQLTPAQLDQLVRIVDVGSPEIRVMEVQVFTNADFAADRIANITTTLVYRQFDTLVNDWVETSSSFVFRKGDETFVFRTRLARDREGRLLDVYDAKAQINYVGTSQAPAPIELRNISDRALTFSYDRLGYVKVEVKAGDIDWNEIADVFVDFVYEPAASEPDAKGTVRLTQTTDKGQWTTSKHGRTSNRYTYTVRTKYKDGREASERARADDRGSLLVHDTLAGKLRRTFNVALDPNTVTNLALRVRYEDPPNPPVEDRNVFASTGSWDYVRALRQGAPTTVKYAYDVQYQDGEFESFPWKPLAADDALPLISARRFRFSIPIDAGGLDWSRWRVAIVEVTYRDERHNFVLESDPIRLTENEPMKAVAVLAFDNQKRDFAFRATLVPKDGSDPVQIPPDGSSASHRGTLLLETLV